MCEFPTSHTVSSVLFPNDSTCIHLLVVDMCWYRCLIKTSKELSELPGVIYTVASASRLRVCQGDFAIAPSDVEHCCLTCTVSNTED